MSLKHAVAKRRIEEQAKRRVALGLILGEIIQKTPLKLTLIKSAKRLKSWQKVMSIQKT